jgi:uncharacterized protein (TIGR03000 family)
MFRKHVLIATALALAAAVILLVAGPAMAQPRRGYYGGYLHGGFYGGYAHGGYYAPHYGGYYHHYGYYPGHYGYYPRHYGYYWGYNPWYYPGYYYSPGYYAYGGLPSGYQAFYPSTVDAPAGVDQVVHFNIRMPADAKIWFGEEKTTQTGSSREFVTPPLAPGNEYTYEVRAQWTENGRNVTQSRRVSVRAGERVSITFPEKPPEMTE